MILSPNPVLSLCKDGQRGLYATANILECWAVSLRKLRLVVFRSPLDGAHSSMQTFESGTINLLAFPEVQISIGLLLKP